MTDDADNLDDSSVVNDNRHMISHDANMICGHLKQTAIILEGEKFFWYWANIESSLMDILGRTFFFFLL